MEGAECRATPPAPVAYSPPRRVAVCPVRYFCPPSAIDCPCWRPALIEHSSVPNPCVTFVCLMVILRMHVSDDIGDVHVLTVELFSSRATVVFFLIPCTFSVPQYFRRDLMKSYSLCKRLFYTKQFLSHLLGFMRIQFVWLADGTARKFIVTFPLKRSKRPIVFSTIVSSWNNFVIFSNLREYKI